jgi:hypothetical protein
MTAIILKGLPHENASSFFAVYVVVFMANGALNAWPAPACNNPIFAGERIFPNSAPMHAFSLPHRLAKQGSFSEVSTRNMESAVQEAK